MEQRPRTDMNTSFPKTRRSGSSSLTVLPFLCVFFCTFLQRTGRGSIVPRNVLTSFARKHANTHAPIMHARSFVRLPADSPSDALPPLRLVEARLAQVFSGKKSKQKKPTNKKIKQKKKKKSRMLSFVIFCLKSKQFQFGKFLPGTKTSQHV